ncbi:MAG: tRNA lysidine(34) synthetase TilS [Bacillota bacterium]
MATNSLYYKFKKYVKHHRLIKPQESIILALSGGCDSVVLLHLLQKLQQDLDFSLSACHLDHCIRVGISAKESLFVQELCGKLAVKCYHSCVDVPRVAQGENLEASARRVRYAFLRETAAKISADRIATAHHADDQAETVLMHLLRGSGGSGLAAILPQDNDLIRPLLFAKKQQIMDYATVHQLSFCEDDSNLDQTYLRNKIRLSLIPHLEAEYNLNIKENLLATAEICRAEQELLQQLAKEAYQQCLRADGALSKKAVQALPLALQRLVVRKAYQEQTGLELSFKQTEAVLKLKESSSLSLPQMSAYIRGGAIQFGQKPQTDNTPYQAKIVLNEWRDLSQSWQYLAVFEPLDYLKADKITVPVFLAKELSWRSRRPGDKIKLANLGHKSIKSLYQEHMIVLEERTQRPILCCGDEPIWLPYLRKKMLPDFNGKKLFIYCRRKCDI